MYVLASLAFGTLLSLGTEVLLLSRPS